ncbi:MAG: M24 family metallopeptidase [Flavobacteriales bacterium]|nr:M24 family metallopeptidase [Flavobacteriales bacterium]
MKRLLRVTHECLDIGIAKRWRTTAREISDTRSSSMPKATATAWCVNWWGHGVGRKLHEPPEVPNYGKRGHGARLRTGMVLAIEPMINMGVKEVKQLNDGWTVVSRDGKPSAHFEHTVVVRPGKAEVLSTFQYIEDVLEAKGMILDQGVRRSMNG